MLKKLKGAKRLATKVRFLVHHPDPDDPDDYAYPYGSIARRLWEKGGRKIISEQKTKIRRNGTTRSEPEKIVWQEEVKGV